MKMLTGLGDRQNREMNWCDFKWMPRNGKRGKLWWVHVNSLIMKTENCCSCPWRLRPANAAGPKAIWHMCAPWSVPLVCVCVCVATVNSCAARPSVSLSSSYQWQAHWLTTAVRLVPSDEQGRALFSKNNLARDLKQSDCFCFLYFLTVCSLTPCGPFSTLLHSSTTWMELARPSATVHANKTSHHVTNPD